MVSAQTSFTMVASAVEGEVGLTEYDIGILLIGCVP